MKIAVAAAFDNKGNYLFAVEPTSKPSDKSTWKALGNHIEPKSHLIHDAERSHGALIRNLNLTEECYKSDYTKTLKDEDNPLNPINKVHALSKKFMRAHGDTKDWTNLLCFIFTKPFDRYEKIDKFINLVLNSPKKMKYRSVMSKSNVITLLFTISLQMRAFKKNK